MTTAEGGAVIARMPGLAERIRLARGHGLTSGTFQRHGASVKGYDVTMLGYNYRLDEFRAAVGLVQLEHLLSWNQKRKLLTERYHQKLRQLSPSVIVPFSPSMTSAFHIMPVVLPSTTARQQVVDTLRSRGIQTSVHYPPTHLFTYHRHHFPDVSLPLTEDFSERELTLPLHPKLGFGDVDHVAKALADAIC